MWPGANASPCEAMEHGSPDLLRGEGLRSFERLGASLPVDDQDGGGPPSDLGDVVRDDEVEADLLHQRERAGLQVGCGDARLRLEPDEDLRPLPEGGEDLRRWGELEGDRAAAGGDLPLRLPCRKVADRGGDDGDVRLQGLPELEQVLRRLERLRRNVLRSDGVVA